MQSLYPPSVTRHLYESDIRALRAGARPRRQALAPVGARLVQALRPRCLDAAVDCAGPDPQAEQA